VNRALVGELYVIGRVLKREHDKIHLEVLISPVHRSSEVVYIFLKETLRNLKIEEGSVIAVRARPRRRFLLYDMRNLDAHEIIQLAGTVAEVSERLRVLERVLREVELKPSPPMV